MPRYRPKFTEEYMPQPSVVGPDLSGWVRGELRNFESSTGYGFVRNERRQDVLVHSATRVTPKRCKDDRSLDVIIMLTQPCDWVNASMPVNGEALYYKCWPNTNNGKLRASVWCLDSDIQGVDKSLDEQHASYLKLPFFTLAIEVSTGNDYKFFRTNRPFRTLQRWLYVRNYLSREERIVCFMESNEGSLRYSEYDTLRQAITRLPHDIKGL